MRNIRNNKGFTLIELMIVVVIIGILAAIAIPRFTAVSQSAKQAEAGPILKQMCTLAQAQFLRVDAWPDAADPADATTLPGWSDPGADYFTFETVAGGSVTATPNAAGDAASLVPETVDCTA